MQYNTFFKLNWIFKILKCKKGFSNVCKFYFWLLILKTWKTIQGCFDYFYISFHIFIYMLNKTKNLKLQLKD